MATPSRKVTKPFISDLVFEQISPPAQGHPVFDTGWNWPWSSTFSRVYWISIFFWKSWTLLLSRCPVISKCHGHPFCSIILFVSEICDHPRCGPLRQARLVLRDAVVSTVGDATWVERQLMNAGSWKRWACSVFFCLLPSLLTPWPHNCSQSCLIRLDHPTCNFPCLTLSLNRLFMPSLIIFALSLPAKLPPSFKPSSGLWQVLLGWAHFEVSLGAMWGPIPLE